MTVLRLWLIIGALLAGALFVACGGDDDGDDTGDGEEPTATTSVEGGETPSDGDGGDGGGDAQAELDQLAGDFANREAKVAYDYTSTAAGTTDQGSFTLYWKPPDAWRLDITSSSGDVILISSGGTTYLCSAEGGEGQCFESPTTSAIPLPFLSYFTDPGSLSDLIDTSIAGVDIDRSEESIGGQDATCYAFSGTADGQTGSGQYCFSDDGMLLRLATSAAGSEFTLEATSVDTTVADADLELPYDLLEIPVP